MTATRGKQKTSLNLTDLWRRLYTEDDVKLAYDRTIEMLKSDNPDDFKWAVEFIAKRFTIPSEKLAEELLHQTQVVDKEAYDKLLQELLHTLKGTGDV